MTAERLGELPAPIETEKTAIDNELRTAFRSVRTSLKNLGFLIPPSLDVSMYGYLTFESTGKNIEITRFGTGKSRELPWPLNTPQSRLGIGWNIHGEQNKGLAFNLGWPTEEGRYDEVFFGYMIKGREPSPSYHYPPETGFHYMRTSGSKPYPKHADLEIVTYASGLMAIDDFSYPTIVEPATMEYWQKEEKPILDRIVASLAQTS